MGKPAFAVVMVSALLEGEPRCGSTRVSPLSGGAQQESVRKCAGP